MPLDNFVGTRVPQELRERFARAAQAQGGSSHVLRILIEGYASGDLDIDFMKPVITVKKEKSNEAV